MCLILVGDFSYQNLSLLIIRSNVSQPFESSLNQKRSKRSLSVKYFSKALESETSSLPSLFSRVWRFIPFLQTWRRYIFSSMPPIETNLYTIQSLFQPILQHLSTAWLSFAGFQSGSRITALLAPVRLSPNPPTLVVSKQQKMSGFPLNS